MIKTSRPQRNPPTTRTTFPTTQRRTPTPAPKGEHSRYAIVVAERRRQATNNSIVSTNAQTVQPVLSPLLVNAAPDRARYRLIHNGTAIALLRERVLPRT